MILGHYVIVDDGGNYVTFSQTECSHKDEKNYNNSLSQKLEPPVFQYDRFVQICLLLGPPSF